MKRIIRFFECLKKRQSSEQQYMTVIDFLDVLNTCAPNKPVVLLCDNIELSLNKGDKKLFRSVEAVLDGFNYESAYIYPNRVTFMPIWDTNKNMYWVKNVVEDLDKVSVTLEQADKCLM